ncbi:MAG: GTPase HflX [Verrucomicrobia bacterium]|nr:MAG: GTPase HflX [Verrucomicrobiota bacterium]
MQKRTERVYLVGAVLKGRTAAEVEEFLDELAELATTAGGRVVGRAWQKLEHPHPATFIGPGKAEELAALCQAEEVDTVIFDDELSPAQGRNLERIFECKILDRTMLILDIFGQRAQTREGKLQVELARLEHLLPRLTRYWTHLHRQKGGIGMRGGEGETQLEVDRRKTKERIDRIRRELVEVRRQREVRRQGRRRHQWPLASVVGYTNAGKSTLFNALTGAHVLEEDKLFATLDPTTRRLRLPSNHNVLLSDTVGFIRKLPHQLVEAFKATLDEVVEADLLIHVVDITSPHAREQIEAVNQVLEEIGAQDKPTLMALNKIDRLENRSILESWRREWPRAVPISARTGEGFPELLAELATLLRPAREVVELAIPHRQGALVSRLHEVGQVIESRFDGELGHFRVHLPPHLRAEFAPYIRNGRPRTSA